MDISVFKSYQIDVGHNPGQIPAINDNYTITVYGEPKNDTDLVNKKYVDNLIGGESTIIDDDINASKSRLSKYLNHTIYPDDIPSGLYLVYREKYEQAVDFLSGTNIDYCPLVKLDGELRNTDYTTAANNILKKWQEQLKIIVERETIRYNINNKILNSTDIDQLQQIKHQIDDLSRY